MSGPLTATLPRFTGFNGPRTFVTGISLLFSILLLRAYLGQATPAASERDVPIKGQVVSLI